MNKNETFFALLQKAIVKAGDVTWPSESDYPIFAVRLPWWRTLRWEKEKEGEAEERIKSLLINHYDDRLFGILDMFTNYDLTSYKRVTKNPSEYTLYIVVSFGWWSVGIKTTLIET